VRERSKGWMDAPEFLRAVVETFNVLLLPVPLDPSTFSRKLKGQTCAQAKYDLIARVMK
jgi:hypothetical protein